MNNKQYNCTGIFLVLIVVFQKGHILIWRHFDRTVKYHELKALHNIFKYLFVIYHYICS